MKEKMNRAVTLGIILLIHVIITIFMLLLHFDQLIMRNRTEFSDCSAG